MSDPVDRRSLRELEGAAPFAARHVGTDPDEQAKMLAAVGYGSLEELCAAAVPGTILTTEPLRLPPAGTESRVAAELRALADRNRVLASMIGLGYSDTITPAV